MARFSDTVALVTGAASGIGLAVVRELIGEGANVLAADINEAGLKALADEMGGQGAIIRCDVTKEADIAAAVAEAVRLFGRLDAAFNVAGSARFGSILDQSEEDWRFGIDLCLNSTFLSMKHEARQMVAQGHGGAIVNVASLNSQIPGWGLASYSAAKAGIEMLGKSGAVELSEYGIRVNSISPGLTATPPNAAMPERQRQGFLERIPMNRMGTPQEIARVCLFLASEDAGYMTGSNVFVDGGWAQSAYPDTRKWFGDHG